MNKIVFLTVLLCATLGVFAQDTTYQNTATRIINNDNRLSIRGYSEVNYNQAISPTHRNNGKLEIRRLVLFTGYKFNNNTSFVSELEVEHANEIYLEQAFINHRIKPSINFRAGLLLIPMGIVNEYHEPTTFNGVERPNMDKYIIPTTWREMGAGFQGIVPRANIAYQVYVVNGFKSYDGEKSLINETNGFRSGRQKGIGSIMSSPNLSAKLDYFGIRNLKVGLSAYSGKTQSTLYDGIEKADDSSMRVADSSVVGLNMFGLDIRYAYNNFRFRAQGILANISNIEAYNAFSSHNLSSAMSGYYVELSYNVLPVQHTYQLFPFVRYEEYNTQANASESSNNDASKRTDITAGLSFFLHPGVVLKADYQNLKTGNNVQNQLNFGVGIWF